MLIIVTRACRIVRSAVKLGGAPPSCFSPASVPTFYFMTRPILKAEMT